MEDKTDLRSYLNVLIPRWKWITGITVIFALVAGAVSFIITPTYEATATVFVLSSSSTTGTQTLFTPQAQLALLQSSEVAQRVIQALSGNLSDDEKNALLRGETVRVVSDTTDKSLFKVTAKADTAQQVLDIANSWANAGADLINQEQDKALNLSIPLLQQATDNAAKELQSAEENLKRLQRELQIDLLSQQISRVQQTLNSQTAERENIKSALALAQTLKLQVQQGQISLSTEMLLNFQTISTATGGSYLIQPSQFVNLSKQQQLDQLDAVIAALDGRQQALSSSLITVTTQAASQQDQLNVKQASLIEPTRVRDTARTNYDSLAAQLRDAQARLTTRQNPARALTRTVPPQDPVAPNKKVNVAIAAAIGLFGSVFGVFAIEYLRPAHPG